MKTSVAEATEGAVLAPSAAPTRMQRWLLASVEAYQRAFDGRPSPCRFFPTCSSYADEAIRLHGAGRGSWLTLRRLLRCRPLGPSGFDPVPSAHRADDPRRIAVQKG